MRLDNIVQGKKFLESAVNNKLRDKLKNVQIQ